MLDGNDDADNILLIPDNVPATIQLRELTDELPNIRTHFAEIGNNNKDRKG